MSEKLKEFVEIPQEFIKEGNQVRYAAHYRHGTDRVCPVPHKVHKALAERWADITLLLSVLRDLLSHAEFAQICKAVAVGFAVMGFIGYFVKLIHIPM